VLQVVANIGVVVTEPGVISAPRSEVGDARNEQCLLSKRSQMSIVVTKKDNSALLEARECEVDIGKGRGRVGVVGEELGLLGSGHVQESLKPRVM
jgi:hypothetical protein